MTVTIDLPTAFEKAAQEIASARGQTVEELTLRAVEKGLSDAVEDAEDERIARERWERIQSGQTKALSHEDVWKQLDALPD